MSHFVRRQNLKTDCHRKVGRHANASEIVDAVVRSNETVLELARQLHASNIECYVVNFNCVLVIILWESHI